MFQSLLPVTSFDSVGFSATSAAFLSQSVTISSVTRFSNDAIFIRSKMYLGIKKNVIKLKNFTIDWTSVVTYQGEGFQARPLSPLRSLSYHQHARYTRKEGPKASTGHAVYPICLDSKDQSDPTIMETHSDE